MTQKKLIIILSSFSIFLIVIYLLTFLDLYTVKPKKITSALLNPNYRDSISSIRLSKNNKSLIFYKANKNIWLGKIDENLNTSFTFILEKEKIQNFLNIASKIRTLQPISAKNFEKEEVFGFSDSDSFVIEFFLPDGSISSTLIIGKNNFSGKKIFIKTEKSAVYEIEDDLFPYLSVAEKQWAFMNFIPALNFSEKDIQQIRFLSDEHSFFIKPSNEKFSNTVHSIFSLRGGNIVSTEDAVGQQIAEIYFETGYSDIIKLKIVKQSDEKFYIIPLCTFHDSVMNEIAKQLSYALEISNWTYDKLLNSIKY